MGVSWEHVTTTAVPGRRLQMCQDGTGENVCHTCNEMSRAVTKLPASGWGRDREGVCECPDTYPLPYPTLSSTMCAERCIAQVLPAYDVSIDWWR